MVSLFMFDVFIRITPSIAAFMIFMPMEPCGSDAFRESCGFGGVVEGHNRSPHTQQSLASSQNG